MSRRTADTVTVKEIEIVRREQCPREVADAILGIFDEEIGHGFRHLNAFTDIRH
jgi:hypothetical protein